MTSLLSAYDRARVALSEAFSVIDVLAIRDELAHVKLHARHVQDRTLLEEATVWQLRAERRLGEVLAAAKQAGEIGSGPRKKDDDRVTLKDMGVDHKLSARAQRVAALSEDLFEDVVQETRDKIRGSKAILVDPVAQATKAADLEARRSAHRERTKDGCNVRHLGELARSGYRAGFIGSDPQWKFLTRSDAGDGRSANVHYKTEAVDAIKQLPVGELAADNSAHGMWCVDWAVRDAIELGEHYGFKHVTTLYTWVKTNGDRFDLREDPTFHLGMGYWSRANPEVCLLFTKGTPKRLHADVRQLIIAPLMEHSRKPDAWLERSERLVEGPYLELNARRRRPGWTAWGDELEWEGAV